MEKGLVFNIQKFSIHDGPGVRTTVFLKGCPLRCKWCSNPESQFDYVQILYDKSKCAHCLTCVHTCPKQAITHDSRIHIDTSKCIGCLSCVHNCLQEALSYEGEYKSVDEVVNVCLQDKDFYEESNGGVTISGGEGMSQPDFIRTLTSKLKEHDIHLAIETTGYIQHDVFQDLAPRFDLLLFDVKHYDSLKHFEGTGVYNDLIVSNLKWAIEQGIEVLPRIPVIPDFNDSLDDAKGIATLLKEVGAKRVQLLPFHQFGEKKYELLNRNYTYKNKKAFHNEDLIEYQKIFLDNDIDCFF
ncbi:MAG: glycyl-radical enzyme activating protein [Erysipelotrichaceae bacterium]|nr:glycyl-radical enzyme activating protein [Erysipelotrichaceae bacterium]